MLGLVLEGGAMRAGFVEELEDNIRRFLEKDDSPIRDAHVAF